VLNIATAAPTKRVLRQVHGPGHRRRREARRLHRLGSGQGRPAVPPDGAKSDYDGNVKNLTTGKNVNGSAGFTVTAKLVWTPTENLTLSFAPRYNHNVSSCCASVISELTPGLFYQGEPGFPSPP
jgi:iron complex outermembrane receptor protein